MGWASWNAFRTRINETKLLEQMEALIRLGLPEYGYEYFNMDDGFFGGRDTSGRILSHRERFPNGFGVMARHAHDRGLKAGIYMDGGDMTCGYYYDQEGDNGSDVGLYGHEEQDLSMYLEELGFDFIKVDWCGGLRLGLDEQAQYTKIGRIIEELRKRTGKPLAKYCGSGHVNDLDMMQLGNGLTPTEEKTHFSMWCMMSTPLMIGCDLTRIQEETLEILKNREMIQIDQDPACLQAYVVQEGKVEVWIKDLGVKNSATKAVAFLNRSDRPMRISFSLEQAGF